MPKKKIKRELFSLQPICSRNLNEISDSLKEK